MSSSNINQLFQSAQDEGILSGNSMSVLNIPDIGAQIQAGLGINVNEVPASEVVLLTIMPDDSGSIRFSSNSENVIDGHNLVIDALNSAKQSDNILAHTCYLNGEILFPYCQIDKAVKMSRQNYNPNKGTPLYDQTVILLGTVIAKAQEFSDNGVPVRTITLLITDGADEHSTKANAKDVKSIVEDMLKTEQHIISAMGIDNGSTNFMEIFQEMGILKEWILTPKNTAKDIRSAFQLFSQSAIKASQSPMGFSQSFLGGFGA